MSQAGLISKTDQNIDKIAYNISKHFKENWCTDATGEHSGFRGIVVCPDKPIAIKYKKAFDLAGKVKTEVVMSPSDTRENNEDVHTSQSPEVKQYYDLLKTKYGNEIDKAIIKQYEYTENIELLIVIDKLLTGFDVPQTIVMYLCRKLKEHTLLQAISRVNRVYPGKDYGYIIDYAGVMQELKDAIEDYSNNPNGFDPDDIKGALTDIKEEVKKLPRAYADLLDIFKPIKNKHNIDEYIILLADEALREEFYSKFSTYSRILKIALSTVIFHENTLVKEIDLYRSELKKYASIRVAVNNTYLDKVSFAQYEKQLQKLLDQHVITEDIIRLVEPINILDTESFEEEIERLVGPRAKAEKIAAATSKYISVNMNIDPVLFKKLSETISDMRANRLSEIEALTRLKEIKGQALKGTTNDIPAEIGDKRRKIAVFHALEAEQQLKDSAVEITIFFDELLTNLEVVDWHKNNDIINRFELEFGDYLMDVMDLSMDKSDEITRKLIEIAIANK